jgi:enoyl-CoA hydratase/carnithine racemase
LSAGTCSRLLDVIGPGHLKDLLFTGRLVPADEAYAIGLVNRVVAAGDLDQAVRELALGIAANAPLTIRATKEMVRRILQKPGPAGIEDADLLALCYGSADFREGVSSFLAKRRPQWSGK